MIVKFGGWLTALVVLIASTVIIVRQTRTNAELSRVLTEREADLRKLGAQLQTPPPSKPEPATPPAGGASVPKARPEHVNPIPQPDSGADQLHSQLAASAAHVARLEARVSELETELERASEESRQTAVSKAEWKSVAEDARSTAEALRAELKKSQERAAELESANAKSREASAARTQQSTQAAQLAAELQQIYRRRDTYLTNVIRRYKELTDQYRSMVGVLESRHDREMPQPSGVELSRIQSTISLAEEDLRQLNTLNAQALRLEKKLK